jgi:hypothetical protein
MHTSEQVRGNDKGEIAGYLPIELETISADSILGFDLYQAGGDGMRLFRDQSVPISREDIDRFSASGCSRLYVPESQKAEVLDHTIKALPKILENEEIPAETKLEILTKTSEGIFDRILVDPFSKTNVQRTVDNCRNHVKLAGQGDQAVRTMTEKRPSASFPVSHALHVSNLSILLGMRCSITDPEDLHALGVGALLHEIGKRIIDKDYYSRQGKGSRITDTRLRKYPLIGYEMLAEHEGVPSRALEPIALHQERLDGSGFPLNLKAPDIGIESSSGCWEAVSYLTAEKQNVQTKLSHELIAGDSYPSLPFCPRFPADDPHVRAVSRYRFVIC